MYNRKQKSYRVNRTSTATTTAMATRTLPKKIGFNEQPMVYACVVITFGTFLCRTYTPQNNNVK